ncbi:MAG: hypothetical protein AB202_03335 [Parcubacteria bacterium C7867-007]|nr:MAG: hypothetical protein AB202_03335 [Parcubacteria bacterium C7867-007]
MKGVLVGVLLVMLIGIGAFVYRSAIERPRVQNPLSKACTLEARICPDGSAVGRSGPNCEFAACAFPNAEDAAIGISFVVPNGFVANPDAIGTDPSLRAVFDSTNLKSGIPDSLVIRRFSIPAGKTAEQVILENTMYESSGIQPSSMKEFEPILINGNTFQTISVERFEALVHTEYYLVRTNDVLRFEVIERDVTNWTDPTLKVMDLPSHKALQTLLSTLQSTK